MPAELDRLKKLGQMIENSANELDQIFQQKHKHTEITGHLMRLINDALIFYIEERSHYKTRAETAERVLGEVYRWYTTDGKSLSKIIGVLDVYRPQISDVVGVGFKKTP